MITSCNNGIPRSVHLGETGAGAEFSACYPGFSDVQVAYADFVKDAVSMYFHKPSLAGALLTVR
jgi:hypothetical protein